MNEYDIVIVGAGPVGITLACALKDLPLRISVVEARELLPHKHTGLEARAIALSYGSQQFLHAIDLWEALAPFITPILKIHVSDQGHFGITRLHAQDENVPALGYVIEAQVLQQVLNEKFSAIKQIDLFRPATIQQLRRVNDVWQISLTTPQGTKNILAKLVIATDGSHSSVRKLQNIDTQEWHYNQHAILTNILLERDHENIAYERFTKNGPLALLPMRDNHCAVIWTLDENSLKKLLACNEPDFLIKLQQQFGYRAGRFLAAGKRYHFPLKLISAKEQTRPALALLGNAAHTLHPVAGQGFNLGLRDVAVLSDLIKKYPDIHDPALLNNYAAHRQTDHRMMTTLTDGLVRLFSNNFLPLVVTRNVGLLSLNLLPGLKHRIARYGMGLIHGKKKSGRSPISHDC